MTEYHEMVKEAAEARIGTDRMAMGLSCIPDKLRGDMTEVERLRSALEMIAGKHQCIDNLMSDKDIARRALEPKP